MKNVIHTVTNFYVDGFRRMTWGRQLWWIIILKLVILFAVLRMFFFKPAMEGMSEDEKIEHVSEALIVEQVRL